MTTPRFAVAVLAAGLALGACSNQRSNSAGQAGAVSDFDQLTANFTGTWSNARQAAERGPDEGPVWMNVELHIVRFTPPAPLAGDADSARWFYVEEGVVGSLDKPYRQHVSKVSPTPDGGFTSEVYTFAGDAYRFAGWWKTPEAFTHHLGVYDLHAQPGCEVALRPQGHGRFAGGTVGSGCSNTSRGATYATTELTITPTELRAWDRGYDAVGRQVWGSTTGPYIFVKQ